ncbi:NAD-dependent epimerase/dehydratase family protein [Hymenobacter busanensis]|uniref:NAD-dependent epimerase/dehydratase family protein n=1 Tax=Hymenobacter busanensis TaxID=2607656 RepID=A0A7L4ZWC2_9BACT|nr:NAD-dependent epimerase/dehydratase family protein [Hymenobacter busanensis]KAA9332326.1 NAD-dependent epimerase/dehydratase family protein [Hymenobacter busanensis]QHJ07337.1 NAD-dependent epimerase/dehydratase family protein [Hymenobacter busanensis]
MKIRAIITGATGMVGEGVLHECLAHPDVEQVLVLTRKPTGVRHPKLRELLHADFYNLSPIESQLTGYNACFFCLGTSSVGMSEADYTRVTHDLTLHVAETLLRQNPDLTFCYVSGVGTDSTAQGRSMWARVKGRTENELLRLPFGGGAYMFRPGYMHPTPGLHNVPRWYPAITWLYPALRRVLPRYVSTLREQALAMINVVRRGYPKRVLEVPDIVALAKAG